MSEIKIKRGDVEATVEPRSLALFLADGWVEAKEEVKKPKKEAE